MKLSRLFLYSSLLVLAACGFHLKGLSSTTQQLPYSEWRVVNGSALHDALSTEISRQKDARINPQADAVLQVIEAVQSRDIQTLNRSGAVNEYLLVLRLTAQAKYQGQDLGEPMTVVVQRNFSYSDNELLGKQQEEADLWQDIYRDAAGQMVRRMSFLPQAATPEAKP
ncbi:MAG: LPS assembly lipoprotein LptE [Neisseria sp.]|nr:LPS assembly lipoprotein LptE [Neisseria sp.]